MTSTVFNRPQVIALYALAIKRGIDGNEFKVVAQDLWTKTILIEIGSHLRALPIEGGSYEWEGEWTPSTAETNLENKKEEAR